MGISEVLQKRAANAVTVGPDDTVKIASSRIAEMGRGLAVVCDESGTSIGIISVIDDNHAVARHGDRAPGMAVRDVMNADMAICAPGDSVEQALDMMAKRGIRHLPAVATVQLQGIVNWYDLLQARFDKAQLGLDEMRRYVLGIGYQ